jgi:hypothetical protein
VGRSFTVAVALAISLSGCTAFERTAPVPSPSPLQADDGTDLAACVDADCEVEVRESDVLRLDAGWGIGGFEVVHLSEEKITLRLTSRGGHLEMTNMQVESDGEHLIIEGHKTGVINQIEVTMIPADSTRAVLALSPVDQAGG